MSQDKGLPPELRAIWTDLYTLHARFNGMGNTVDEWMVWWKTAASIVNKHNGNKLAEELVLGLAAYMENERRVTPCEESGTAEQTSQNTQNESNPTSQLAMF